MHARARLSVVTMVFAATVGCDRSSPPAASRRPAVSTQATGEWIARQIQTRIDSTDSLDPAVTRRAVRVTVADGVVTLRGEVGSEDEKRTAEQIAAEAGGVIGVRNELVVQADDRAAVRRGGT
jgi:osmotically-inducible protein OsmY